MLSEVRNEDGQVLFRPRDPSKYDRDYLNHLTMLKQSFETEVLPELRSWVMRCDQEDVENAQKELVDEQITLHAIEREILIVSQVVGDNND